MIFVTTRLNRSPVVNRNLAMRGDMIHMNGVCRIA